MKNASFVMSALGVSAALAGGVSYYASSHPDGLNKVAIDLGFAEAEKESALSGSPLADYSVAGIESERLSTAVAGITGVLATAAVGGVLYLWVRKPQD